MNLDAHNKKVLKVLAVIAFVLLLVLIAIIMNMLGSTSGPLSALLPQVLDGFEWRNLTENNENIRTFHKVSISNSYKKLPINVSIEDLQREKEI